MKTILICWLSVILPCFLLAERHGARSSVLDRSSQLIVVTTSDWNSVDGRPWNAVGAPIPVVVGKGGMGWGIGVRRMDDVRTRDEPVKREGDRKAPAGIFSLGPAFGYAPQLPHGWKMPYLALTPSSECVDDSHSRFYNRLLDRSTVSPDWKSAEHMREAGEAYQWGVVIKHNASPSILGGGSCVFMHIWAGSGVGTEGCTAMPGSQIGAILAWLNPTANPLLVQMPVRQYRRIEPLLRFPSLPSNDFR
jgi:D-alanyl-D-alanine dipeptidase